ncbi:MAG: WXG100 family type VII secretion target [Kiritimatiellae bacterium]|nr:WXG100 family type VII secretion target [Kiritimatiellia bacterium]
MQPLDLETAQTALHEKIRRRATELGHDSGKISPIYDGVADAKGYLSAKQRLMWILKEPYDSFDETGEPCGGGWTMIKDVAEGKTLAQVANANPALRNVAYASHAILDGTESYEDEPWISDAPKVYERSLLNIAYVNVGKMPAGRTTSDERLFACYAQWKDILFEQIELYDPETLVFGNTLQCFAPDMGIDLDKPVETVKSGCSTVNIYIWQGRRIVWAPHPAAYMPPADWVNSVSAAVRFLLPRVRNAASAIASAIQRTAACLASNSRRMAEHREAEGAKQPGAPNGNSSVEWKTAATAAYHNQRNTTTTRSNTMSQVHADPDALREFASRLAACEENIEGELSATSAAFFALGDTWNDAKRAEFEESFRELCECIRRFSEACNEQVPHLHRLADRLDEFNSTFC